MDKLSRRTESKVLVAGVDGCKGGWLSVTRDTVAGEITSAVYPTAQALVSQQPALELLCIDIPIGLCDWGPRDCDVEARRFIQARRSSVFPAPLRPMLDARTYEEVCQIGLANGGKKLSRQGWAIVPKIREVDQVLRNRAGAIPAIREVHPEVCFAAWAGSPMRHPKKGREGQQERQGLVADHFGWSAYEEVRKRHPGPLVASDDILDAFAALRTAERVLAGTALTLPRLPPHDRCGLVMEMVY